MQQASPHTGALNDPRLLSLSTYSMTCSAVSLLPWRWPSTVVKSVPLVSAKNLQQQQQQQYQRHASLVLLPGTDMQADKDIRHHYTSSRQALSREPAVQPAASTALLAARQQQCSQLQMQHLIYRHDLCNAGCDTSDCW
jgi:hypothetical protein